MNQFTRDLKREAPFIEEYIVDYIEIGGKGIREAIKEGISDFINDVETEEAEAKSNFYNQDN